MLASRRVPSPGLDVTVSSPRTRATRSRIPSSPNPPLLSACRIEAAAVVLYLDDEMPVFLGRIGDPNRHVRGVSVLDDVVQRLLDEPIDGSLDVGYVPERYATILVGEPHVELDLEPALRAHALDERLYRRLRTQLVQCRRPQLDDQRPQVRDALGDHLERLVDRAVQPLGLVAAARSRQQHFQAGQLLKRLVMQLTRPAPTLVLGRLHAALQRLVRGGLRRGDRRRSARRERLQQALVLLAERAIAAQPVKHAEEPDRAVAEHHRRHERGARAERTIGEALLG